MARTARGAMSAIPPDGFSATAAPIVARRGLMLILSSPSGAGKTTLTRMLLQDKAINLTLSVSVTTRARRSSEVDGIHYHFITRPAFERRRADGELYEFAEVHGNCYGSPRGPVEAVLAQGRDVLFDIDYQGAQQMRQKAQGDIVTIFILPPSMRELRARLIRRAEDSSETIAARLANARQEIQRWDELRLCARQRRSAARLQGCSDYPRRRTPAPTARSGVDRPLH